VQRELEFREFEIPKGYKRSSEAGFQGQSFEDLLDRNHHHLEFLDLL
jgi:hypothetical protein